MKEHSYGIIPYLTTSKGVFIGLYRISNKVNEYQFLKGKPLNNEAIKDTVVREIFEEIGVNININDLNDKEYIFYKSCKKNIGLYFVDFEKYLNESIILENGIYELKLFKVDNLPKIVKNQELFVTDILIKFELLNFYLNQKKGYV